MRSGEREYIIIQRSSGREAIVITPTRQASLAYLVILLAVAFERLAWFSLSQNLIVFLSEYPLCFSEQLATNFQLVYNVVMFGIGIFGGWVSDSYISRYAIIIAGYIMYILGYLLLVVATYIKPADEGTSCPRTITNLSPPLTVDASYDAIHLYLVFAALVIIPFATGCVNTNLAPFGADQNQNDFTEEGEIIAARLYFTRYYWAINAGSVIAFFGVATLQQTSFSKGFLVALVALVISFIFFYAGTPFYTKRYAGYTNIVTKIARTIYNAREVKKNNPSLVVSSYCDYANMDNPGGRFNGDFIKDVKKIWKMFRVFALMIPYWICYSQMLGNLYLVQGLHMNADLIPTPGCPAEPSTCSDLTQLSNGMCNITETTGSNGKTPEIAASTLATSNGLCILIALPLAHKCYHFLTSRGRRVVTWHRMMFGMILAVLSLLSAGAIETVRLENICHCGVQRQIQAHDEIYYDASLLSIWLQIPQYCLLGASEVFFSSTGLEYAYIKSPKNTHGLMMGLFWFSVGVGHLIALSLPDIFSRIGFWKDSIDINCNRLDIYFYVLAGFLIVSTVMFSLIAKFCDLGLDGAIINRTTDSQLDQPEDLERIITDESTGSATTTTEVD